MPNMTILGLAPSPRSYPANVINIHDGDTLTCVAQLGHSTRMHDQQIGFNVLAERGQLCVQLAVRFYGINAPELATPEGQAARATLVSILGYVPGARCPIVVRPWVAGGHYTQEKYGRWLATIFSSTSATSVNDQMVAAGAATPYLGGPR